MKIPPAYIVLLVVVLTAGLQTACHRRTLPTPPVAESPVPVAEDDEDVAPPTIIPNPTLVVSIKKTPCFGSCPVFTAQVLSDGTAVWQGERNTARIGAYETRVSNQWVNEILSEARAIGFFDLAAQYPAQGSPLPDLPQTITFIDNGDKQHRVKNNSGAPAALIRFEKMLEEKLNSLDWKPAK